MTKCLAYETPDGVVVIYPNPSHREPKESDDAFLSRVWARNVETAAQKDRHGNIANPHLTKDTKHIILERSDVPTDRATRDKWKIQDGKIIVGK